MLLYSTNLVPMLLPIGMHGEEHGYEASINREILTGRFHICLIPYIEYMYVSLYGAKLVTEVYQHDSIYQISEVHELSII